MTITRANIFHWQREWLRNRTWYLAKLFSCPYCMSHWVAAAAVYIFRPEMIGYGFASYVVSWLVIVALASLPSWVIENAYGGMHE